MRIRIQEPGQPIRELELQQHRVKLGRDPACEIFFDPTINRKISRIHAELVLDGGQLSVRPLSQSNSTLVNDQQIGEPHRLRLGDIIRLGFTGPTIEILTASTNVAETPATMMSDRVPAELQTALSQHEFAVGQGGILGRDPTVQFVLDHPQVSRRHAKIGAVNQRIALADLGSANGTFVNGERLAKARVLEIGDAIDIGPFALIFDGKKLLNRTRANNIQLVASSVRCDVTDTNRKRITLLQDVSLVLNPGEFLCILGPSGSGKSTLLNMLSGRRSPTAGQVLVNGRVLHKHFSALKQDLAVVPQACVLHDSLTVEQSLRFTAELRLPPDLEQAELRANVFANLQTVGLQGRRNVKVRQLSGGQLKRAGLGTELTAEPSLLFLDEVTSGLDEQSDGEMMRLFRTLADAGKTLVCVTHNLAHVEDNCHLIAVLTVGGRLAFYGTPSEAKAYFQIDRLSEIYPQLEKRQPVEWAQEFGRSSLRKKHIDRRLPKSEINGHVAESLGGDRASSFFRQFWVLLKRTLTVWRGDSLALGTLFFQAILIAALLCLVFGAVPSENEPLQRSSEIRNLLFLICVSCFWLGCNNCVKEIVKERLIYQRERDFNLIPTSYLASKLAFFFVVGLAQCLLLCLIVFSTFHMPGDSLKMFLVVAALMLSGTCLGLGISAVANTEEMAVALVPVVIIPQIVLAGVVASLSGFSELLAQAVVPVYWGQLAVEDLLPGNDRLPNGEELTWSAMIAAISLHSLLPLVVAELCLRRKTQK